MGVCMAALLAFYRWRRLLKVKRVFKGNYMSLGAKPLPPRVPLRAESELCWFMSTVDSFFQAGTRRPGPGIALSCGPHPQFWAQS